MYDISYSQKTDRGCLREHNEDFMGTDYPSESEIRKEKGSLFVIADGLGGLAYGEIASKAAVLQTLDLFETLKKFETPSWLEEAFQNVNSKIYEMNCQAPLEDRMATTLTASIFFNEKLFIGHVGDCRVFQIRDKKIICLTKDHAINRHTLTRAIGTHPDVEVDLYEAPLKEGDIYLQCSDGFYSMLSEQDILKLVLAYPPAAACEKFIKEINELKAPDNITLQIMHLKKH